MIKLAPSTHSALARRLPILLTGAAALLLSAPVSAQVQRVLVNGSFEQPATTCSPANWSIVSMNGAQGWTSVAPDGAGVACGTAGANVTNPMEIWMSSFNGVSAPDGNQFIELNGHTPSRIWQPICLMNGEEYTLSFHHRGRDGRDTVVAGLNPMGDTSQTVALNSSGLAVPAPPVFGNDNNAWGSQGWTGVFQATSGTYQLSIASASTFNGEAGAGNLLDNVRLTLNPLVELVPGQNLSVSEGGTVNVQLRVSGGLAAPATVNLHAINGSASNSDYTVPGGTPAAFTATIPAGDYDGSQLINVPITAATDSLAEAPETLQIELLAGTGYTLGSTATCGSPATTTAAITINDVAVAPVPLSGALSALVGLTLAGLGAMGLRRRKT